MDDEKRSRPSPAKGSSGADFAGLGIQFALAIVVFLFAGQWLDRRLGTNSLFTIVGVFVGAVLRFFVLVLFAPLARIVNISIEAALVSLVTFFFLTMMAEPLLLEYDR